MREESERVAREVRRECKRGAKGVREKCEKGARGATSLATLEQADVSNGR